MLIVGAGGLGSLVAESLAQLGFQSIALVDPDHLEVSNVGRVAGASYKEAKKGIAKVKSLKRRLRQINPEIRVDALQMGIEDSRVERVAALVHWIIVTSDNHSSRLRAQELAFRFFTPLISAGVNISLEDGLPTDMSGEVITIRIGDRYCLSCLGRVDHMKIAAEDSESAVGNELVRRGYVEGAQVREPAVKTLNAIISAMACDRLLNTYTDRQIHRPIVVYENNNQPIIFEDYQSVEQRSLDCFSCGIIDQMEGPISAAISQLEASTTV